MRRLFAIAGHQHQRARAALNIDLDSSREKERRRKVNVWLYSPEILIQAGYVTPEKPLKYYGIADDAGLHLVANALPWDDPLVIQIVLHEAVHLWWADQVGKAPSLLNEGIAVYVETILGANTAYTFGELGNSWQAYAARAEPGFLRQLCKDEYFWKQDAAKEPVFMVGGHFIAFLLETYGMPRVRQIFLKSHASDPDIADHMEDVIGESIEHLERRISEATGSE
ncbi:MAG: hypothetical protein F4X83_06030 [Chloroflexi bacterium]|nr:hypothetical protein [Chloroflexota bacterium]